MIQLYKEESYSSFFCSSCPTYCFIKEKEKEKEKEKKLTPPSSSPLKEK
jgi:hypothetical protein